MQSLKPGGIEIRHPQFLPTILVNDDSQVPKFGEDHPTEDFIILADVRFADIHKAGTLNVVRIELSPTGLDSG